MQPFLDSLVAADRSAATVAAYAKHLAHFANWFRIQNDADLTPAGLTATDVKLYRQTMLSAKLSPSTINLRLAAIRAYAAHYGLSLGAVRGLQLERPAPRWLDKKSQSRLLRASDLAIRSATPGAPSHRLAIRDRAILTLLINAKSGSVNVRQGKGFKARSVPLNADARDALRDWRDVAPVLRPLFGLTATGAWRVVRKYAKRSGVTVTPHMLRHTFAKSMVDADTSLEQVAALMGHNDLGTTRRYTLPSAEDLQRAVERIAG